MEPESMEMTNKESRVVVPEMESSTDTTVVPDLKTKESFGDLYKKTKSALTLSWDNVSYSVTVGKRKNKSQKVILNGLSGQALPGQVVAIMGASGSGKTTLLNTLAGRLNGGEVNGDVLLNGRPRNPLSWKQTVAYVEQDDVMYENLTVRETLTFAALLRLPSSLPNEEKLKRVNSVIQDLGLLKCQDTRIGDGEKRGISGGERKRVSIGMELVTDPNLLFLDEPTSGLDAFTAQTVVEGCSKLAKQYQKTIIMTIHQPRTEILELFDKIILLSGGKTVWFGPLAGAVEQFAACGFPCPSRVNPSDHFLDTMTIDYRSEELKESSIKRCKALQEAWEKSIGNAPNFQKATDSAVDEATQKTWPNNWLYEFMILLRRNTLDVLRDPATLGATFGQAIINMLLIGFIFFQSGLDQAGVQNRIGVFFFICINMTFSNVMPTIATLPIRKIIIKRERSAGTYRASSAYLAQLASNLPALFAGNAIFAIPIYFMIGFQNDVGKFFTYLVIMYFHAMAAQFLGLMIGSGVPNVRVGQILGPTIIVVFFLFSGNLVDLQSTPIVFRWIKWISIIQYSYTALSMNELDGLKFTCGAGSICTYPDGDSVLRNFYKITDYAVGQIWLRVVAVAALAVGFVIIGYALFRWRSKPSFILATKPYSSAPDSVKIE